MISAVNLQVGEPIFNRKKEKLGDKQCHFVGAGCEEVDIAFRLEQLVWGKPKPDIYEEDIVVPVK